MYGSFSSDILWFLLVFGYGQIELSFMLNKTVESVWKAVWIIYLHNAFILYSKVKLLFLFGLAA